LARHLNPIRSGVGFYRREVALAALAAIGSALCLMLYHEIRVIAPLANHSAQTFVAYAAC
jgi:hypothetical protein